MEASRRGKTEIMVRSRLNTSTAKIMAAMGDWKIDAMAPAEAQAINRERVFALMWKNRPKLEGPAVRGRQEDQQQEDDYRNSSKRTTRGQAARGRLQQCFSTFFWSWPPSIL